MVDVRLGLILLSLLFTLPFSRSATVTWNVADGDWSNDINWDTGVRHLKEGRKMGFIEIDRQRVKNPVGLYFQGRSPLRSVVTDWHGRVDR